MLSLDAQHSSQPWPLHSHLTPDLIPTGRAFCMSGRGCAMTTTDDGLVRLQRTVKLTAVCHQAKRVVPKTRTFEGDPPTQWDVLHHYLDDLLDELGY